MPLPNRICVISPAARRKREEEEEEEEEEERKEKRRVIKRRAKTMREAVHVSRIVSRKRQFISTRVARRGLPVARE